MNYSFDRLDYILSSKLSMMIKTILGAIITLFLFLQSCSKNQKSYKCIDNVGTPILENNHVAIVRYSSRFQIFYIEQLFPRPVDSYIFQFLCNPPSNINSFLNDTVIFNGKIFPSSIRSTRTEDYSQLILDSLKRK